MLLVSGANRYVYRLLLEKTFLFKKDNSGVPVDVMSNNASHGCYARISCIHTSLWQLMVPGLWERSVDVAASVCHSSQVV